MSGVERFRSAAATIARLRKGLTADELRLADVRAVVGEG